MKRVLIVGPSPTKSKGGMATVIEEINNDPELRKKYDIDIFESYIDGSKIKVLLYSLYAFAKFVLKKKDYDIYHIHAASRGSTFRKGWYVKFLKKRGLRVILHIHGAEYMKFFDELTENKKKKVIDILKSADMVLALSNDWKSKFDLTFGLTNCFVLENGINQERLKDAQHDDLTIYQCSFVALGRLGERKGTYDIIKAVSMLKDRFPEVKCYLAGDGEIEIAKKLVHEYGVEKNVKIVGWADFEMKLSLLKKVDTVLLPSYNEGLPMSVLEGMACGKAIISTFVGAIPEVVGAENGILITPGDISALTSAMEKCCVDIEMIKKFSYNNICKIEKDFSTVKMHSVLSTYYEALN